MNEQSPLHLRSSSTIRSSSSSASADRSRARFRWVKAPTSDELTQLTHTIAQRLGRYLEHQGFYATYTRTMPRNFEALRKELPNGR